MEPRAKGRNKDFIHGKGRQKDWINDTGERKQELLITSKGLIIGETAGRKIE